MTDEKTPAQQDSPAPPQQPGPGGALKPLQIFLVVAIVVAFVGFFVGTRSATYAPHYLPPDPPPDRQHSETMAARSYSEIMRNPLTKNDHWVDGIQELSAQRPELYAQVENTPAARGEARRARAENRAFAGAPPTVPHPVKQTGDLACVACHTDGVAVRGRVASPMSHEFMANCTQCHVPGEAAGPMDAALGGTMSRENSFQGLEEPSGGPVAWAGAPPQIPHATWMRQACTSCHGPMGREGMKSTHPWRQNCEQCHAASAALNQQMPPETLLPAMPLADPSAAGAP